ncbi:hypothetical protein DID76_02275 [Candidatus Marinamargulisbacteria bacterium SCGC AG-414-C22]|nr:hypothetical protein DID76_02275 [Candidatus Marinamargulisbacteria bacterium SCGC AG-414-C22]
MSFNKKTYLNLFFCLLLVIGITGCARTYGERENNFFLDITLTLNGAVDTNQYNYYIIFSKSESPSIEPQLISDNLNEYFPAPGQVYADTGIDLNTHAAGDLSYYYDKYFDTWSDFILIQDGNAKLVRSQATQFDPTTSDNYVYTDYVNFEYVMSISGNSISFRFDVNQIGLSQDDLLYFRFLTAKRSSYSNDASGILQDTISTAPVIKINLYQELQNPNESITSGETGGQIDQQADIVAWEADIF